MMVEGDFVMNLLEKYYMSLYKLMIDGDSVIIHR